MDRNRRFAAAIKRVWQTVSNLDTLLSLLQRIGWLRLLMDALGGTAVSLMGVIEGLPISVAVTLGVVVTAVLIPVGVWLEGRNADKTARAPEGETDPQPIAGEHPGRDPYEAWLAANIDEQRVRYLKRRTQTEEGLEQLINEWREVVDNHDFRIIEPKQSPVQGFVGVVSFRKEPLYPEIRPFLSEKTKEKIERNYPPTLRGLQGKPLDEIQRLIHRDLDLLKRYRVPTQSESEGEADDS